MNLNGAPMGCNQTLNKTHLDRADKFCVCLCVIVYACGSQRQRELVKVDRVNCDTVTLQVARAAICKVQN